MAFDTLRLILLSLKFLGPYIPTLLLDQCRAIIHEWTYRVVETPKNIVIIGGSFAGIEVAQKLANSVPTGYKVVLMEKNSHFNWVFNFPRYSVLQGHEHLAFIPYEGIVKGLPKESLEHICDVVDEVKEGVVKLASGREVEYAFLVIATGCSQSPPGKLSSADRESACQELRGYQKAVEEAGRVAIVGGGAVGVELVADIKDYYPEKKVMLVHSRERLLNRFGPRLHQHVMSRLEKLGVEVLLNERPDVVGEKSLRLKSGELLDFDLIIPCTGQTPHSTLLSSFLPFSISPSTKLILVHPTLQIATTKQTPPTNIFALGDVAETSGPKMARAAFFQASIVQKNILSMIAGRDPKAVHEPREEIEGALKLTLGKKEAVVYCRPRNGEEILLVRRRGKEDLEVERAWRMFGGDVRDAERVL